MAEVPLRCIPSAKIARCFIVQRSDQSGHPVGRAATGDCDESRAPGAPAKLECLSLRGRRLASQTRLPLPHRLSAQAELVGAVGRHRSSVRVHLNGSLQWRPSTPFGVIRALVLGSKGLRYSVVLPLVSCEACRPPGNVAMLRASRLGRAKRQHVVANGVRSCRGLSCWLFSEGEPLFPSTVSKKA